MIKIEKIIPGGYGLGTDENGKKMFFWNALPGELIKDFKITKNKPRFTEAVATSIVNASAFRVKPLDDCFLSTSPWQICDFSYELELKSALVQELFREHQIDLPRPEVVTDGRDYHYRNKMEYSLYWDNETGQISLAFHARGSHQKVPITSSSLERPEIFQKAQEIVADLNARHEEARKYQSLLLRANQNGAVSGGLFENGRPHPAFPPLSDPILGQAYTYSPNGFFQINLPVYELALLEIKKHIHTAEVLDLYAGVGTIGLSVARDKKLTLVESDPAAFGELSKNVSTDEPARQTSSARSEDLPITMGESERVRSGNILACLAKSEKALDYITPAATVILDPPRAGCDRKLLDRLLEVRPETVVYLSCNPATQARDVKILLASYQIAAVKTFNFFPHTPHIENLVVLTRK